MRFLKEEPVRDREYLDWLRTQPCIFSGIPPAEGRPVDPAHIGTLGKGIKSSDDEALPVLAETHRRMHQQGEMLVVRQVIPDWLLREALRAYAREAYRQSASHRAAKPSRPDPV